LHVANVSLAKCLPELRSRRSKYQYSSPAVVSIHVDGSLLSILADQLHLLLLKDMGGNKSKKEKICASVVRVACIP